jgi:chemotaxis-related protein WspD
MSAVPMQAAASEDCWARIGVSGDRSCGELARHVHCRNCPEYAAAARRNLERTVDPGYRAHWAAMLSQPPPAARTHDASALVFRVGREWLALPVALVASVAPLAPVHRLPHRGGGPLLGVVNVGGRLAPAVSLATVLGIDEDDAPLVSGRHVFARLLVLRPQGQRIALPVAELHGMVRYAGAGLLAPAATVGRAPPACVAGVIDAPGVRAGLLDADLLASILLELLR